MKNAVNLFKSRLFSILLTVYLLLFITDPAEAQFDSLIWMNRYSNHSVCSRDNVQKALFINGEDLYIGATTERDYSNFDVSAIRVNNNLDIIWNESYSSSGNRYSYDKISDVTVDSSGNMFILGSSEPDYPAPFLMKRDPSGKLLWIFDFKKSVNQYLEFGPSDIETDTSGNCYVLAWNNAPGPDIWSKTLIFKFDGDGNLAWFRGTDVPHPQKIVIDAGQDILTINNSDEQYKHRIVLQKYSKNSELVFDSRSVEMRTEGFNALTGPDKSLFIFSNRDCYISSGVTPVKAYISEYDSLGNLVSELLVDDISITQKVIKLVQPVSDSAFIIGIDSYTKDNGIDNQLIRVNTDLQITDSVSYDGEWHDNDYLISFDQAGNNDIIVTGISFIDAVKFVPFIYRIRDFKTMEWMTTPSISDTTSAYPKSVFAAHDGSVILVGDAEMSVVPSYGTTHSNVFITRFSSSGAELQTREYDTEGKSYITASDVKIDGENYIYASGLIQNGPDYLFPRFNYDQDAFLCKYSPDGAILWNSLIDLPKTLVDFTTHFVKGDSLITVVCATPGWTYLYNFDTAGNMVDSTSWYGYAKKVLMDDQGSLYLFLWRATDFLIVKLNSDLSLAKNYAFAYSPVQFVNAYLKNNFVYFVIGNAGEQILYKYGTDLEKIWQFNLSSYFEYFASLETDSRGNIYIAGSNAGKTIKLTPAGTVTWVKPTGNGYRIKMLSTGDLLYCSTSDLMVMSNSGDVIKKATVPFYINHFLVGKSDMIYLFDRQNRYRKYSPALDLLTDDSFAETSNGYNFYLNSVASDSAGELIIAGSNGVSWLYANELYSWHTLAVARIGQVNSSPMFLAGNYAASVHPGGATTVQLAVKDWDNDLLFFNALTQAAWFKFNNNTALMTIRPGVDETIGEYRIPFTVSDDHGASDTAVVTVTLVNKDPYFTSQPVTTALAYSSYSYRSSAKDPDNDALYYEVSSGPGWLTVDNSGLLYGTPAPQDAGTHAVSLKCYDRYGGLALQNFTVSVSTDFVNGIEDDLADDDGILIYPMPAKGRLNVVCREIQAEKARIMISDSKGSVVRLFSDLSRTDGSVITLDIDGISPGLYYLLIIYDGHVYSRRIAVQ